MGQTTTATIELRTEKAIAPVDAGLDALLSDGLAPADNRECIAVIEAVERCRRRLEAARAELVDHIDRQGLHAHDGHVNAKAMLRHVGNQGFRQGRVGVDQLRLVGRVNANPRVAHYIGEHDDRNHHARDFRLRQDLVDLSWTAAGQFAAFQGAAVDKVFRRYEKAEWEADWENARAQHGADACVARLARTPAERRADAFWQMVQDAANATGSVAAGLVHNIVWSSESFEATVASLATGESPRLDPLTHRCSTLDGVPLEPTEAAATVLVAKVRRVVVNASGTAIDLGRAAGSPARPASPPGCNPPAVSSPGAPAPPASARGFSVGRDPSGTWHTTRPDGTEVH